MSPMSALPLSSLVSQALVAFTIELDNEFEHRSPHFTTDSGGEVDQRCLAVLSRDVLTACAMSTSAALM